LTCLRQIEEGKEIELIDMKLAKYFTGEAWKELKSIAKANCWRHTKIDKAIDEEECTCIEKVLKEKYIEEIQMDWNKLSMFENLLFLLNMLAN